MESETKIKAAPPPRIAPLCLSLGEGGGGKGMGGHLWSQFRSAWIRNSIFKRTLRTLEFKVMYTWQNMAFSLEGGKKYKGHFGYKIAL